MAYDGHDRERWVAEDPVTKRADRDDFSRDRARLLHSASLRRLSAKTQVLGPADDDFSRNRLTHSLEVAQIGREFGEALGCNADVVETACLAHDLGHPPFGHNGETALDGLTGDIGGFEGNAQTLRILTRLEAKRAHRDGRPAGLNLTRATLDAAVKYPWLRGEGPDQTAKFGAYADDAPAFDWLRSGAPARRRCIEAQVMDWSDDVAYSVHDVEDAVASRRLDLRSLRDADDAEGFLGVAAAVYAVDLDLDTLGAALERILATGLVRGSFDGSRADLAWLKDMTSGFIGRFVLAVERATRAECGEGALTRHAADLVVPEETRAEVAVLKSVAAHFVMRAAERLDVLARQREMVAELVTAFAERPEERLDADLLADWQTAADDASRLRVVVDQVASLTDTRAILLHSQWA